VVVHPADQPGGEVIVAEQLLVVTLGGVVLDVMDPQLGPIGELADGTRRASPAGDAV
jgi:hypothetical protein